MNPYTTKKSSSISSFGYSRFEVPGVVISYAMAQYEVLSARWGTDWIGLDKAQTLEGGFQ